MKKKILNKIQVGIVSFSAIALLAACETDDMEEPPVDLELPVEEPVDEEEPADEDEEVGEPAGGEQDEEE